MDYMSGLWSQMGTTTRDEGYPETISTYFGDTNNSDDPTMRLQSTDDTSVEPREWNQVLGMHHVPDGMQYCDCDGRRSDGCDEPTRTNSSQLSAYSRIGRGWRTAFAAFLCASAANADAICTTSSHYGNA